jgi:hypothetical protein
MTWPDAALGIAKELRPALIPALFILALWGYRKATNESLPETLFKTIREVRGLVKGSRGPHEVNALLMILVFLLMIVLVATPLKDLFLVSLANNSAMETDYRALAFTGFFILFFCGMGLVCVHMCRFYDGD